MRTIERFKADGKKLKIRDWRGLGLERILNGLEKIRNDWGKIWEDWIGFRRIVQDLGS